MGLHGGGLLFMSFFSSNSMQQRVFLRAGHFGVAAGFGGGFFLGVLGSDAFFFFDILGSDAFVLFNILGSDNLFDILNGGGGGLFLLGILNGGGSGLFLLGILNGGGGGLFLLGILSGGIEDSHLSFLQTTSVILLAARFSLRFFRFVSFLFLLTQGTCAEALLDFSCTSFAILITRISNGLVTCPIVCTPLIRAIGVVDVVFVVALGGRGSNDGRLGARSDYDETSNERFQIE